MTVFWIVVAAVIVGVVIASWVWLEPAEKRARGEKEAAVGARVREILADGWHRVEEDPRSLPPVVRRSAVRGGTWLIAARRVSRAEVWLVCQTRPQTGPGGVHDLHRVVIHIRPLPPGADVDLPDIRVRSRTGLWRLIPGGRRVLTGDRDFDRRFLITSGDRPRATAAITEQVRAEMMKQKANRWRWNDGVLTLEYPGLTRPPTSGDPAHLRGLIRLARLLSTGRHG